MKMLRDIMSIDPNLLRDIIVTTDSKFSLIFMKKKEAQDVPPNQNKQDPRYHSPCSEKSQSPLVTILRGSTKTFVSAQKMEFFLS